MKKIISISLAVIGLGLGAFAFNSCEKDNPVTTAGRKGSSSAQETTKTCVHPLFQDKIVDVACADGHSCSGIGMYPANSRNRIRWRVSTQCSYSQNFTGTCYYNIYKYASTSGGYQFYNLIATFTCTNPNMWYASTLLTNSSTFIITVGDVSGTMPSSIKEDVSGYLWTTGGSPLSGYVDDWKFSTGTQAGTPCIRDRNDDL